jgi:hypothetical protein
MTSHTSLRRNGSVAIHVEATRGGNFWQSAFCAHDARYEKANCRVNLACSRTLFHLVVPRRAELNICTRQVGLRVPLNGNANSRASRSRRPSKIQV